MAKLKIKVRKGNYEYLCHRIDVELFESLGGIVEILENDSEDREAHCNIDEFEKLIDQEKTVYRVESNGTITEDKVPVLRLPVDYHRTRNFFESYEEARMANQKELTERLQRLKDVHEGCLFKLNETEEAIKRTEQAIKNNSSLKKALERKSNGQ